MVGILCDLLLVAVMSATTDWSFLCLIPALHLPNFGLILATCLACILGFCFSGNSLGSNSFLCALCTSGNVIPVAFVCDHVYVPDIDLVALFCNRSHIKHYTYQIILV